MAIQNTFERYEMKYLISGEQLKRLLEVMEPYTAPDAFPHSQVQNIYYDTDDYRLIRRSLEKPDYKEKLRLRRYGGEGDPVFVELKKKYESVVYKRRICMDRGSAEDLLDGGSCGAAAYGGARGTSLSAGSGPSKTRPSASEPGGQISREIEYFLNYYRGLSPKAYIYYDRDSYAGKNGDLRITFDKNIVCRTDELDLDAGCFGRPILEEGMVLMELKCSAALPLWLTSFLSKEKIYQTSYSKYGSAYCNIIYPALRSAC